ncbi:hypothetical protein ALC56_12666 [Trachymyrmex septentrionalis]|uniref:Uncharacterized protein n=1 Tax=Trachymyrmex septentrionalis TaxID=34720 RepID=A0A195EYP7_9HYME|nr:hypothetical protein ALC56_12666 [Trachymyrmex septentrionalis]
MDVAIPVSMETAKMYISEPQNGHTTTKYASTNSIPAMMEQESSLARILGAVGRHRENAAILRDTKTRRHSVLEDLKARRDSLIQRARRVSMFEEKENSAKDAVKDTVKIDVKDSSAKEKAKDKRRGSESGRRGSVFYVSEDLLEENQEVLENEDRDRLAQEAKKARRKSWHPLVKPPKLDRKRRKGVVSAVPSGVPSEIGSTEGLFSPNYPRQKRPSWWNIFIPESRQVDNAIQTQLLWDSIVFKHARILAIFFMSDIFERYFRNSFDLVTPVPNILLSSVARDRPW